MKLINLYNQSNKDGANWYHEARLYCQTLADSHSLPLKVVVGVLSALSPATDWERNKLETLWLIQTYKGQKVAKFKFTTYGQNVVKAQNIISGKIDPDKAFNEKTGAKTYHFYKAILEPDSPDWIVIDRHAYAIATGKTYSAGLRGKQYRLIANRYRAAAKRIGVTPSSLQAVLWVDYRNKLAQALDTNVPF